MKRFFCSLVLVLACAIPVFATEMDNMMPENAMISEEGQIETEASEEIVAETAAPEAERYVSQETDMAFMETLPAEELVSEAVGELNVTSSDGVEERVQAAGAANNSKYYSQAAYQVKTGYDLIAAYIRGEDGKYASRLFFVYDKEYKEWLRYDYSAMAAQTFLSTWEEKDSNGTTLYVPVAKKSGEKTILHSDISGTALDESKVPVLLATDVANINYAWKALADIPFVKSGGNYEYAAEESTTPDPPQPVPGKKTGTVTINGKNYVIYWTETLKYNGKAHVWNCLKNTAKQAADVEVEIIRDGALVDSGNYSIVCKSNTNVTGFGGSKTKPYFVITMKGNYKKDAKKMSKYKFTFDITPCSLTDGMVRAKKVVISGTKTSFTKPFFVFPDGKQVSLTAYSGKKPKGTYTATVAEDGSIQVTGYNNFSGTATISMDAPKKVTYEW